MYPDMEFIDQVSEFTQDFEVASDMHVRGIYYLDSQRSVVYLKGHEVPEDLPSTCSHETYHHCFCMMQYYGDGDEGYLVMDEEQEHDLIRYLAWSLEQLKADEKFPDRYYDSQIHGKKIKPKINPMEYKKLMRKANRSADRLFSCVERKY